MKYRIYFWLAAIFLALASCKTKPTSPVTVNQPEPVDMEKAWKKVDSLENKGLFTSALETVQKIKSWALHTGETGHLFKSVMYENKYLDQLEEDAFLLALKRAEGELNLYPEPMKSVMHSLVANWYSILLQNRLWSIRNRTEFVGEPGPDPREWGIRHFIDTIQYHYQHSVSWPGLVSAEVGDHQMLLTEGKDADSLRPTLYDILMHRALAFFSSSETYLTSPAYGFVLNDPQALAPARSFIGHEFRTQDEQSATWLALKWYQQLLGVRLSDSENTASLIDADMARLRFIYDNMVHEEKDNLYQKALENLLSTYGHHAESSIISYYLAQRYMEQAATWQGNPESPHRYAYNTALEICKEAIRKFPNAYGSKWCQSLINGIQHRALSANVENVNLPDEALLAGIEYRNLTNVHLRIVKLPESSRRWRQPNWDSDEVLSRLLREKIVHEWQQSLDDGKDYQPHRTEIAMPALPLGQYALLISDTSNFNHKSALTGAMFFSVSSLAYWVLDAREGESQGMAAIVDRKSGQPVQGVKVEFYTTEYNPGRRVNEDVLVTSGISDKTGWVKLPPQNSRNLAIRLLKDNDELFQDQYYYFYRSGQSSRPDPVTLFFSDRAIYRPGQKFFFKGYALQFDAARIPSIVPNQPVTVTLYDVNGQTVAEQKLVSNAYGTFSGHFDLPSGGLTGAMSVGSSHGQSRHQFRVEEYKRPKFEVVFDTIQSMPRLDEVVTVRGIARDYAGSMVSGATANYRVERVSYRPWWWGGYFRGRWPSQDDRQVLATGTSTTGDDGSVEISFQAKPKPGGDKELHYRFEITLYVTDITGESHEAVKSIALNRQGYDVHISLQQRSLLEQLKKVPVSATNSDGAPIKLEGKAEISVLTGPDRHKRDRLWESPDILTIPEYDYVRDFPNYAIPGMENMSAWPIASELGSITVSVDGNSSVDLSSRITAPGFYKVHWIWKYSTGQELSITQYIMVYDRNKTLPGFEAVQTALDDRTYEPGDLVKMDVMTGLVNPPSSIRLVERRTTSSAFEWHTLPVKGDQSISLTEHDRGGVIVHHMATYNNRFYSQRDYIRVPWTNKDLKLVLRTWRDKLEPGDDETWTITVSGDKGQEVEAEMLLSMYDASLDAFVPHQWNMSLYPSTFSRALIQSSTTGVANFWSFRYGRDGYYQDIPARNYRDIQTYGYYPGIGMGNGIVMRSYKLSGGNRSRDLDGVMMEAAPSAAPAMDEAVKKVEDAVAVGQSETTTGEDQTAPPLRSALDETVFFYPQLNTDDKGNLVFAFKMKEGLTRWKFQALAHKKDLAFGLTQAEVVTQKDLMVFPNPPRFFRAGDTIAFQAKVTNMTDSHMSGHARLKILDAFTLEDVSAAWGITVSANAIKINAGSSAPTSWMVQVPADWTRPVTYQIAATAGSVTDGEESMLPVVTNRILVTETLPLPMKAAETRTFVFKSMLENRSSTSKDHRFAVEMTTSPAWYAVQALPYLMEYPHECAEQIFSRLYANALAAHVANKIPKIKQVYHAWRMEGSDALLSPLQKNQELKSAMLEETPWVRDAMGETQQKKDIALLFEENRINQELKQAMDKLATMQLSNGGFPWFPGGKDNWYITQYIVEGFGHLEKMGVQNSTAAKSIIEKAVPYIDARIIEWYDELKRQEAAGRIKMSDHHVSSMQVHYLYARSFFPAIPHKARLDEIRSYIREQLDKYWLKHGLYEQGLIALASYKIWPDAGLSNDILASLRERTIYHEELGRYWKVPSGYNWNQAPVELQSLMIELYQEMGVPQAEIDELRVWLLKQKQTTRWKTTKATASAIYALLIHPDTWLSSVGVVKVSLGNEEVIGKSTETEAGTGYIKKSWDGDKIGRNWSSIIVSNPNNHIAWGSAYWQYWEDLDKVKESVENNPLKVTRSLLRISESDRGPQTTVAPGRQLKVGDQLVVRLTLETDRAMEFVHLKDLRASGFEPVDVLSGYKWGGGIGYYQSTKDLATHFFIDYLPRGKYVLEYQVTVAQAGAFSEGLATLQCMYAPEFGSHSAGSRVVAHSR